MRKRAATETACVTAFPKTICIRITSGGGGPGGVARAGVAIRASFLKEQFSNEPQASASRIRVRDALACGSRLNDIRASHHRQVPSARRGRTRNLRRFDRAEDAVEHPQARLDLFR